MLLLEGIVANQLNSRDIDVRKVTAFCLLYDKLESLIMNWFQGRESFR